MAHGLNRTLCLLWSIKFYWHTACPLVHHSPGCFHVTVAEITWPEKPKICILWPLQDKFTVSFFTLSGYFWPHNPKCTIVAFHHAFTQVIPATQNCLSSTTTHQLPCAGSLEQKSNIKYSLLHSHTQPPTFQEFTA